MVADCLPVLFVGHNPQNNSSATAAVHAGRRGLLDGIMPETVKQLTELGATRIEAVIGPAICGRCYEVPQEMLEESEARVPGIGSITSWDTPALDLPRAAAGQLRDLAVEVRNSGICTWKIRSTTPTVGTVTAGASPASSGEKTSSLRHTAEN
ncbi:polyphenol oxidase family protein [Arthrobacter sp. JCM 19049]|uniref:polyphenol oxidase family protein n=1 Tax=Arthrobacter sp. JCM 19049 TaxID=1460643 RepID=UPI000AF25FAB|nr:polyphenol oxidase family protein [Arthrobacter sp. JCM 19049]